MSKRFEQIVRLRFAGIEAEPKPEGKEPIDLADYPWEECVKDQTERYGDEETAMKICGWIKANYQTNFAETEDGLENACWPGYVAIGTKELDGKIVPNCVPEEKMKVVKEGFPIPSPESGEEEDKYISRCISSIIDEYGQEQGYAICKSKWDEK
jgi:hypothetical protein